MNARQIKSIFVPARIINNQYYCVIPPNQDWNIRRLSAFMGEIKRSQYEKNILRLRVFDMILLEIPLVMIDDISRASLDKQNDLARRVCILENKPLLDSGKITEEEFDDLINSNNIHQELVPMFCASYSNIRVEIQGGELPEFSIVMQGYALYKHSS